jgi:hypothetical protein
LLRLRPRAAAVTIGVNIGLFGTTLECGAVVVLVTVVIAGIVTRIAARGVAVPKVAVTPLASAILVPSMPDSAPASPESPPGNGQGRDGDRRHGRVAFRDACDVT